MGSITHGKTVFILKQSPGLRFVQQTYANITTRELMKDGYIDVSLEYIPYHKTLTPHLSLSYTCICSVSILLN